MANLKRNEFPFGALQLRNIRNTDGESILKLLDKGEIPWLRIEGLVENAQSKDFFSEALRVAGKKRVCNCDFNLAVLAEGSLTLEHLDVRRIVPPGNFPWEKFPNPSL